MTDRPLIAAFVKVRDEIVRENDLSRLLRNLEQYCDAGVFCDDASCDGTREYLRTWISAKNAEAPGRWRLIEVPPAEQDFRRELYWKQKMLEEIHAIRPAWCLWLDGDETLDANGTMNFRKWVEDVAESRVERAWRLHYTQFWKGTAWARTDAGFDDGYFVKLWRWSPDLVFDVIEGTHHHQFPRQVEQAISMGLVGIAPFEQLHWGNFGANLKFKCLTYWGGLGGVDRHLLFEHATYRPVDQKSIPEGCESVVTGLPAPFTEREVALIRSMENLRGLKGWFTVVIPTYNRADTLGRAIDSVLAQTYESFAVLVVDDGSTDGTPALMRHYQDQDPRVFYVRFPENKGGVHANERGMAIACEWTEYWTRCGSDDYFGPHKLAYDAAALSQYEAVYGSYVVVRDGKLAETCNPPRSPEVNKQAVLTQGFIASWANCAVRTGVLRAIRAKYGNFCDPRLRNMEDFLVNARIARETPGWVWRGPVKGALVVNPPPEVIAEIVGPQGLGVTEVEAVWTAAATGASGNAVQYMRDENLTRQLIVMENLKHGR